MDTKKLIVETINEAFEKYVNLKAGKNITTNSDRNKERNKIVALGKILSGLIELECLESKNDYFNVEDTLIRPLVVPMMEKEEGFINVFRF